jgi:hypothetical protein
MLRDVSVNAITSTLTSQRYLKSSKSPKIQNANLHRRSCRDLAAPHSFPFAVVIAPGSSSLLHYDFAVIAAFSKSKRNLTRVIAHVCSHSDAHKISNNKSLQARSLFLTPRHSFPSQYSYHTLSPPELSACYQRSKPLEPQYHAIETVVPAPR